MRKKIYLISIIIYIFILIPIFNVQAARPGVPIETKEDIRNILNSLITWLYGIVGVIATLILIIGGIMYMTAAGDEDRISKAKKMFVYGIIGLLIAIVARGIESVILSFLI